VRVLDLHIYYILIAYRKDVGVVLRLLERKQQSMRSKSIPYLSSLHPVLSYECETWSVAKGDVEKLMNLKGKYGVMTLALSWKMVNIKLEPMSKFTKYTERSIQMHI
jgi:hypothetical protein